jgi:hypothetical protein
MSAYQVAHALGKFVWELECISVSEYMGWIEFFQEQARKAEGKGGNLLTASEDDLVGALTGGS